MTFVQCINDFLKGLSRIFKLLTGQSKNACSCEMPPPKLPDPLIYSQYYLLSMGKPVTWDNPDIFVYLGSQPVNPHDLQPDTAYTVVARVWNNSTDVPVVNLKVNFSYLSFGMATVSHQIGVTTTDLNVKGLPGCPAFAYITWTTPAVPGHYCIQVLLEPPTDKNWLNNLGQRNVHIGQANSPAFFNFRVGNPDSPRTRAIRFTTDSYRIPPLLSCDADTARAKDRWSLPVPVPEGWTVVITPETFLLAPDEEQQVHVSITPAAGFTGVTPVNITAWDSARPLGGVTLNVEVL